MKKVIVVASSLILGTVIAAGTVFTLASPAQNQVTDVSTTTAVITTTEKETVGYISADTAQAVALNDANLSKGDVIFKKTKLEHDDGIAEYEVEFYVGKTEYEYSIDAITGAILDKEIDTDEKNVKVSTTSASTTKPSKTTVPAATAPTESVSKTTTAPATAATKATSAESTTKKQSSYISTSKAKGIALTDAGVKSSQAVFTKVKLDRDDGRVEYEIDFYVGKTEYEYSIDAKTGKILDKDIEHDDSPAAPSEQLTTTTKKASQNSFISVSRAKSIALKHAGVSEKNASFKKVKLEKDDGIYEYEVEFYVGNWEYEYSIDAKTGKILDFEKEIDD